MYGGDDNDFSARVSAVMDMMQFQIRHGHFTLALRIATSIRHAGRNLVPRLERSLKWEFVYKITYLKENTNSRLLKSPTVSKILGIHLPSSE